MTGPDMLEAARVVAALAVSELGGALVLAVVLAVGLVRAAGAALAGACRSVVMVRRGGVVLPSTTVLLLLLMPAVDPATVERLAAVGLVLDDVPGVVAVLVAVLAGWWFIGGGDA